ncbi:hypothetical protein L873DRAFT_1818801 [Choiromyces venosus 120613-1]|uniref:Transmembrane protein n=1 Tax=Choiromyces venosus 120613-1 TaxID=1336337 RepID=A0A3N4J0I6_9PEZI|nr:hypothetical protein L873DRAFT_1818801 [Choiromyces venosus 120613-1]
MSWPMVFGEGAVAIHFEMQKKGEKKELSKVCSGLRLPRWLLRYVNVAYCGYFFLFAFIVMRSLLGVGRLKRFWSVWEMQL